jgi:FHA domain-containing protein
MPDYVLEIVEGPGAGRRIELSGPEPLEIGREPGVGIELAEDELVSLHHARVTQTGDGVIAEDLDSRNGTFVNGVQIYAPAHLEPGDQLLVGVTLFALRDAKQAAGVHPIPAGLARIPSLPTPQPEVSLFPDFLRGRQLDPLLEVHTSRKARGVPLAIFVLAALALMIFLAIR